MVGAPTRHSPDDFLEKLLYSIAHHILLVDNCRKLSVHLARVYLVSSRLLARQSLIPTVKLAGPLGAPPSFSHIIIAASLTKSSRWSTTEAIHYKLLTLSQSSPSASSEPAMERFGWRASTETSFVFELQDRQEFLQSAETSRWTVQMLVFKQSVEFCHNIL